MSKKPITIVLAGLLAMAASDSGANPSFAQQAYIKASNTGVNDGFSISVAASGDTLVVGAPTEASNATGIDGNQADNTASASGAAYVFTRNGMVWNQQAYLKASNTGTEDLFGSAVAISGDTIAVGAFGEASNSTGINGNQADDSAIHAGAVYLFVRDGTTWSQQAYIKASNAEVSDEFGISVALSGDTLVVGAMREDSGTSGINGDQQDESTTNSGAVYVFVRDGTVWSQQAYIKASNPGDLDFFGSAVAISGDTLVVGALGEASNAAGVNGDQDDDSAFHAGAAYVFTRFGDTWSQQAYLKSSNPEFGDEFGGSVDVSGNTLVVGATGEASSATGVGGDHDDNSAFLAGAAYVFARQGTAWQQQAYLKASNTNSDDAFGRSVAIDGGTILVGAPGEASGATGIGGEQGDNSAFQAGAAYVFARSGGNWSQQAYLKASGTEADDWFGYAVAMSDNSLAIGAWLEDSNATGVNGDQENNTSIYSGAAYVFLDTLSTQDFTINAGLNDAWFNLATAGQGLFFTVFPDVKVFFLSWFTFDTVRPAGDVTAMLGDPGHRWVTAFGTFEAGAVVTLDVELTTGGVFNAVEPEPGQSGGYGTLTIQFVNCREAILWYAFPALGLHGAIELTRVSNDNVALCEALIGP